MLPRPRPRPLLDVSILVVDDHDDGRDALAVLLRVEGALVSTAATADEALTVVDEVDIVLTDIQMPGHDGLWLLERIRERPRCIPVIALTAYAGLGSWAGRLAGFDRILRKPFAFPELVETIRSLVGLR
jgi:CheY-like chemotaxis protein